MRRRGSEDLDGFARAVVILARAKPASANRVISAVPAKISNFLVRRRGVDATVLVRWTQANPDWAEKLRAAVWQPELFVGVVEAMADAIRSAKKSVN